MSEHGLCDISLQCMTVAFRGKSCVLKRAFSNSNFNRRRAMFWLLGREHANIWIVLPAT